MLEHGVLAPDWRLAPPAVQPPDAPGGPADLLGRPALLLFFSIGCAGCTGRAIPFAKALAARYPGLRVLAIHSQPGGQRPPEPERVRAVTDWLNVGFPVLLDDGDATYRAYEAEGTPHWLLLDGHGRVRRSIFGSMDGARQRLAYALEELLGPASARV